MSERHSIIAFIAILFAICYLATVGAVLAYHKMYAEALGFGGITTGLVGVIGTFRPKGNPMASTETGDVNLKEKTDA